MRLEALFRPAAESRRTNNLPNQTGKLPVCTEAARKSIQPSENISDGFAQDAAAKTGVTDRAVRYAVQIGEDITPEARDAIRATPAAERRHVVAFRLRTGAKQTTTCRPFSNIRIGVISVSQEPPSGGFADSRRRRWAKTCPTKAL